MSVQSVVGNIQHDARTAISDVLNSGKTFFDGVVGDLTASLGSIWGGGFIGMSEAGMAQLKTALDTYCNEIEAIISEFNADGDIDGALKGEVNTAAKDFIGAVKLLLQAYVSQMRKNIQDADEAWKNWQTGAQDISKSVVSDAESIRKNAQDIHIGLDG